MQFIRAADGLGSMAAIAALAAAKRFQKCKALAGIGDAEPPWMETSTEGESAAAVIFGISGKRNRSRAPGRRVRMPRSLNELECHACFGERSFAWAVNGEVGGEAA